jgi:hypothetical protein
MTTVYNLFFSLFTPKIYLGVLLYCCCFFSNGFSQNNTTGIYLASNTTLSGVSSMHYKAELHNRTKGYIYLNENISVSNLNALSNVCISFKTKNFKTTSFIKKSAFRVRQRPNVRGGKNQVQAAPYKSAPFGTSYWFYNLVSTTTVSFGGSQTRKQTHSPQATVTDYTTHCNTTIAQAAYAANTNINTTVLLVLPYFGRPPPTFSC